MRSRSRLTSGPADAPKPRGSRSKLRAAQPSGRHHGARTPSRRAASAQYLAAHRDSTSRAARAARTGAAARDDAVADTARREQARSGRVVQGGGQLEGAAVPKRRITEGTTVTRSEAVTSRPLHNGSRHAELFRFRPETDSAPSRFQFRPLLWCLIFRDNLKRRISSDL